MSWNQILVYARVAELIGAESTVGLLNAPYANLWAKLLVDLGDDIWVFDDEL